MPQISRNITENYIIRIYRRRHKDPRLLVGVAEEIGGTGKKAFANLDELWAILNERNI